MNRRKLNPLRWLAMAGLMSGVLLAQDDQQDEQGRGVARLSLLQGEVTVKRGDSGEWVAAAPNAPLVVQDQVLTSNASKAEIQLDYANFVRMADNSELRFAELEYRRYILQLARGMITFRVLRDSDADVEVSTPSVAVRPVKRGAYRITVQPDGTTEITVRSGEVEIFTPRGSQRVKSGKTMLVRGDINDPEFQLVASTPRDGWDGWNDQRDSELERSQSYKYVSQSVYGAEDLDNNGNWVYDAPYGWVWSPTVAVDWAPYRHGRWSWVDYYGWSWVSYDPWGWAPYHYGRWYQGPRGWCWWPGAIRSRHYWSPGLVAWVGFGGGGGVGVGFGNVGWIPLAPHEPYHRWYGSGYYRGYGNRNYGNNITVVNNVNIRNVYRNARVNNGVTVVNSNDFAHGRFNNHQRVNAGDFDRANLVRGQLPVAPERSSLRVSDRDVSAGQRGSQQNRFYSRRTPSNTERYSFDDQRRGVEEMSRRAFGGTRTDQNGGVAGVPSRTVDPGRTPDTGRRPVGRGVDGNAGVNDRQTSSVPVNPKDTQNDRGGWRRFGDPSGNTERQSRPVNPAASNQGQANPAAASPANESRSRDSGSWRRFGEPGSNDRSNSGVRSRESAPRNDTPREAPRVQMPRRETQSETPRAPRSETPRSETPRSQPSERRQMDRSGGEPLRLNPPIVRERNQDTPRPENVRQRAPERQRSTPENFSSSRTFERPSSGGRSSRMEGFGGSRGSSGGGFSGRSSGESGGGGGGRGSRSEGGSRGDGGGRRR